MSRVPTGEGIRIPCRLQGLEVLIPSSDSKTGLTASPAEPENLKASPRPSAGSSARRPDLRPRGAAAEWGCLLTQPTLSKEAQGTQTDRSTSQGLGAGEERYKGARKTITGQNLSPLVPYLRVLGAPLIQQLALDKNTINDFLNVLGPDKKKIYFWAPYTHSYSTFGVPRGSPLSPLLLIATPRYKPIL